MEVQEEGKKQNIMEVQEEGKKPQGNALYTLLSAVKLAYRQYRLDLDYVKNTSDFWMGKTYMWGRTHVAIAKHNIYWKVISKIEARTNILLTNIGFY